MCEPNPTIPRNNFRLFIALSLVISCGTILGSFSAVSAQTSPSVAPKPSPAQKGIVNFLPSDAETLVPEIFRQGPSRFQWELKPIRTATRHHVWALRFPSPLPGEVPANNIVHAEYFLPANPPPEGGRYPAAVVLHILGADFPLSRFMAARLADNGIAALFVQLPYYGKRKPADLPEVRFLSGDLNRSVMAFRQGVLDIRRAIAWLASRPEVDPKKIHATGISLGGIMAALATAIDPMASGGVFVLAGGGLADILWNLPEKEARTYREAWQKSGRTFDDLSRLVDPFDPLTYADRLRNKRVKMIVAKVDEVVPARSGEALWKAAGEPEIVRYDAGHYSAAAFILPAMRETIEFIARSKTP
ncbi:abhydrolase domain-containing 18 [bacterium]|nr:abhydrolase domain-containing 18 [bacterium]